MSCIAGIVNLNGAPVDRELLERMTRSMENRAPDESNVWVAGNVGFGHAMLRISPESEKEHQPCSLDGKVWITADARIDGRSDLVRQLRSANQPIKYGIPDVELILHAYSAFGDSFLDHLIGDFAFALWDSRKQTLICARDHFGVRPFFYARTRDSILFASNMEALTTCQGLASNLDEGFITDFLLVGCSIHPEFSVYRDIRRLLPANCLKVSERMISISRYWEIRQPLDLIYCNTSEYAERFLEVFQCAVKDRTRGSVTALELSGGLDSSAIAAIAAKEAQADGRGLIGYTSTNERLGVNDDDRRHAAITASYLGIEQECLEVNRYGLFERLDDPSLKTQEPFGNPYLALSYDKSESAIARGARLMLTGQGGDGLFAGSTDYYASLLRGGHLFRFVRNLSRHIGSSGTLKGTGLRSAFLVRQNRPAWKPPFPSWLDHDFATRNQAQDRWNMFWNLWNGSSATLRQLKRPWLPQAFFEGYEAFGLPIVASHPFFDLRLVEYLLGIPNFALTEKSVARVALQGKLPEAVRLRPKASGGTIDWIKEGFARSRMAMEETHWHNDNGYIDRARYAKALRDYCASDHVESTWSGWLISTPMLLDCWLSNR